VTVNQLAHTGTWTDHAACRGVDPEVFFPVSRNAADASEAIAVCRGCPVRHECLATALTRAESGVWGGTTEAQRRRLRAAPPAEPDPDGPTKQCTYCHQVKPVSAFWRRSASRDGLDSHCRDCASGIVERGRRRRIQVAKDCPPELTCQRCDQTKAAEEFPIDRSRTTGRHPWCKPCHRAYERERHAVHAARASEGATT
jgi:WhiB family transcriptional regulator, redox-sensing transcriptional regulator